MLGPLPTNHPVFSSAIGHKSFFSFKKNLSAFLGKSSRRRRTSVLPKSDLLASHTQSQSGVCVTAAAASLLALGPPLPFPDYWLVPMSSSFPSLVACEEEEDMLVLCVCELPTLGAPQLIRLLHSPKYKVDSSALPLPPFFGRIMIGTHLLGQLFLLDEPETRWPPPFFS